jgi:hypothetical protein
VSRYGLALRCVVNSRSLRPLSRRSRLGRRFGRGLSRGRFSRGLRGGLGRRFGRGLSRGRFSRGLRGGPSRGLSGLGRRFRRRLGALRSPGFHTLRTLRFHALLRRRLGSLLSARFRTGCLSTHTAWSIHSLDGRGSTVLRKMLARTLSSRLSMRYLSSSCL